MQYSCGLVELHISYNLKELVRTRVVGSTGVTRTRARRGTSRFELF